MSKLARLARSASKGAGAAKRFTALIRRVMTKIATAMALMLSLLGCVIGEKMSRLHPDMTKAEVVSVLGRPDVYKQIEGHEIYLYSNRLPSGWPWDRADYNVVFKNDHVVEYGAGEVRSRGNGVVVIVPVGF